MIAAGGPLTDILKSLCDTLDAQPPKIISTAMLMDPDSGAINSAAQLPDN